MKINDLIYLQNPWLHHPSYIIREDFLPKRHAFSNFFDDVINLKQIVSLTGLRRVGKSTMIKQIIARMLKKGISPREILYFSFDQPTVAETKETLEEVIRFYFNKIINKTVDKLNEKIYLFFDEIQLVPFWQDILKRYYDLNQNIKFIVSGSSSLFVRQRAKESLAGRIFETGLSPLFFSEYKKMGGDGDFIDYLHFGQFPELLQIGDSIRKVNYLKEGVIGKILEVDIVKTYGIRKTIDFERLFWSLLPNAGQIIQSARLMSDLQMKKATLFKYLAILEQSLLIYKVLNLSGGFRSEKRLLRKLYPASTNFFSLLPESVNKGFIAESYTAMVLKEKYKNIFLYNSRRKEIDFLIPDKKIAIEIKYQETVHPFDWAFLLNFVKENQYEKGIIITKNEETLREESLLSIPLERIEELK